MQTGPPLIPILKKLIQCLIPFDSIDHKIVAVPILCPMKMKIIFRCLIVVISFFLVPMIVLGGCVFTGLVSSPGVTNVKLDTRERGVLSDGSIILKTDLVRTGEGWYLFPSPRSLHYTRFIVASPDVVKEFLENSATIKKTRQDSYSSYSLRTRVVSPGQYGWQMLPFHVKPRNADARTLPVHDINKALYEYGDLPYTTPSGIKYISFDGLNLPYKMQKDISWWHYPLQIFLIPAVALDKDVC